MLILVDKDEFSSRWLDSSLFTSGGKQDQTKTNPQKGGRDMEISKLTISPQIAKQNSTQTQILKWMQEHPKRCKHTNISQLAREIPVTGVNALSRRTTIKNMVNNQMLTRFGGKRDAQFLINYLHKNIPQEVFENAPPEEQKLFKQTLEGIKRGKTLSTEGVLVTKTEKKKETKENEHLQKEIKIEDTNKHIEISIDITDGKINININQNN